MKSFETLNAGKTYAEQIKPFNFLVTAHVIPFGHPEGADPEKFHLVTPYDSDSRKWLEKKWIDQHSKKRFRITTHGHYGTKQTARVKIYGDVVTEYEFHPESKCADGSGNPCERQTTGLLQRRHVKIDLIKCIGKESNTLETVDEGLKHSERNVYTEYADPKRSEWITKIQPALKNAELKTLVEACGTKLSRREIIELRAGRSKPHRKTAEFLGEMLRKIRLLWMHGELLSLKLSSPENVLVTILFFLSILWRLGTALVRHTILLCRVASGQQAEIISANRQNLINVNAHWGLVRTLPVQLVDDLWREAYAAQQVGEARVASEWVHPGIHPGPRQSIRTLGISFVKPLESSIRLRQANEDTCHVERANIALFG